MTTNNRGDFMAGKEENVATDDAVLQMLLTLADEDGFEFGVTLNISGAVVAGTLIGPSTYYEGILNAAKGLEDSTMSHILTKKFNDLKEAYTKEKEDLKAKKDQEMTATFIHLKNAKYIEADGITMTKSTAWWRGRISAIDGVSFRL
jgi:hypothetical protein